MVAEAETENQALDVEALKRLDIQELRADDFDEGWRDPLADALIVITRKWPAIIAALERAARLEAAMRWVVAYVKLSYLPADLEQELKVLLVPASAAEGE